jgi:hypothetical protein
VRLCRCLIPILISFPAHPQLGMSGSLSRQSGEGWFVTVDGGRGGRCGDAGDKVYRQGWAFGRAGLVTLLVSEGPSSCHAATPDTDMIIDGRNGLPAARNPYLPGSNPCDDLSAPRWPCFQGDVVVREAWVFTGPGRINSAQIRSPAANVTVHIAASGTANVQAQPTDLLAGAAGHRCNGARGR